jgi:hypothetical protein
MEREVEAGSPFSDAAAKDKLDSLGFEVKEVAANGAKRRHAV